MVSTTCSMVIPVLLMILAPRAICNGEVARLESFWSRALRASRTLETSLLPSRWAYRGQQPPVEFLCAGVEEL